MDTAALAAYYARRAPQYDSLHEIPERQDDLNTLGETLSNLFTGHHVLDAACGTAYWTERFAPAARSVTLVDINPEMLSIARDRLATHTNARFQKADVWTLNGVSTGFTAAYLGFWWSHIPKARIDEFLTTLHVHLAPNALVVIADNRFVDGSSTPLHRTDPDGNTYQMRLLADGSRHEVIKNFTTTQEFLKAVGPYSRDARYNALTYYWYGTYSVSR